MLLAGFLIRNIKYVSEVIVIEVKWGVIFRNIALSIILSLAGLGLDAKVEYFYFETYSRGHRCWEKWNRI